MGFWRGTEILCPKQRQLCISRKVLCMDWHLGAIMEKVFSCIKKKKSFDQHCLRVLITPQASCPGPLPMAATREAFHTVNATGSFRFLFPQTTRQLPLRDRCFPNSRGQGFWGVSEPVRFLLGGGRGYMVRAGAGLVQLRRAKLVAWRVVWFPPPLLSFFFPLFFSFSLSLINFSVGLRLETVERWKWRSEL